MPATHTSMDLAELKKSTPFLNPTGHFHKKTHAHIIVIIAIATAVATVAIVSPQGP